MNIPILYLIVTALEFGNLCYQKYDHSSLLHRKEMAMMVINADAAPQPPGQHQDEQNRVNLLRGLWGDPRFTCRALVLDLTQGKVNTVLR